MKHLLKHFTALSLHPKNAAELKGLILQLAVQGKLTAQWRKENPNIKSASVLLEHIKVEKAKLVKEGKIKNGKLLSIITEGEIPYDLPKNWVWCRLGEVTDIIAGASFKSGDFNETGGVKCIKITNAGVREFVETNDYLPKNFTELYPNFLISEGDLILALTRPYIKDGLKISVCPSSYHNSLLNQRVASIRSMSEKIFHPYIFTFIQSPNVLSYYKSKFDGKSQQPNMKMGDLTDLTIALPPANEQKAIIEIVNQLFAEVEQLEEQTKQRIHLKEDFATSVLRQLTTGDTQKEWEYLKPHFSTFFTELPNIKKLRESILQLAVQGKLTTHWRSENPDAENVSLLLKRIKAEKSQLLKEGKIKKEKPLPVITENEIPYELPEGWVWCRMGEISAKLGAGSTPLGGKSAYLDEGVMFFRSQNVHNYYLKLEQVAFIGDETHEKMRGTKVIAKDLLLNITGGSIGRCALVPDNFDTANVSQHVAIVRLIELGLREYIHTLVVSPQFQQTIMDVQVGVSREGLSMNKLKLFLVPLPPLNESIIINEKVNSLMALCDQLEQAIQNSQTTQEDWMKSSLRAVFA